MNSWALNMDAIIAAIKHHNGKCPEPATEVQMNPYEVERLGEDTVMGLPIVGNPDIGTGRFRVLCPFALGDGGKTVEEEQPITVAAPKERELTPA